MSARAWEAILAAWSNLDALVAAAVPSGAGDGDAALEGRLGKLREDLSARLGQLIPQLRSILTAESRQQLGLPGYATGPGPDPAEANALAARGAEDEVEQTIVPLVVHLDERVLGRLPERLRPSWHRLQEDVIDSDNGGEVFYDKLEALLASPLASPLVLEVYLFCLCEEFFGRYYEDREQIAVYKARLARRLPAPLRATAKGASSASAGPTRTRKALPAWVYYVAAVAAAVLLILLLRALAR